MLLIAHSICSAEIQQHVIVVIIDGARYSETLGDPSGKFIPRMHALAQQGVVVDSMFNDSVTYTKRAIPAIWCGSWSLPQDTIVNGYANQYATAPTVWEYFRKAHGVDSTHAMYIMKKLNSPWIQSYLPDYGPSYWPWYILQGSTDLQVWENAKAKLLAYHPELAVLYFPDVDSAPGAGWDAYTRAITIADSIVGMLWDLVQNDPIFKNTTSIIITNDHGRHLDGVKNGFVSHGDGCSGCRQIMLLGVGAGFKQGFRSTIRRALPDITPTIGALLDFPVPFSTGSPMMELFTVNSVKERRGSVPTEMIVVQNYPNPFNPSTTIRYSVRTDARPSYVHMSVHDVLGREVAVLVDQEQSGGWKEVQWDAAFFAGGIYFLQMSAGTVHITQKMVLLK